MQEIANLIRKHKDIKSLWYKVNWIIVQTSHRISNKSGRRGHQQRQIIRRELWSIAKNKFPKLREFIIPKDIRGDSPCNIKPSSSIIIHRIKPKITQKFSHSIKNKTATIWFFKKYNSNNIPSLISAIFIGFFMVSIPIIHRMSLYHHISHIPTYFIPVSLGNVFILLSIFFVLIIFLLFLLNGLGIKPNRFSKNAGYVSILLLFVLLFKSIIFYETSFPVLVMGKYEISYWVATYGIAIIGMVYLIFFELLDKNKRNRWKIFSFSIVCLIILFAMGILLPVVVSSTEPYFPEKLGDISNSINSKYHVGEIATNTERHQGLAIISDDGSGHYTIKPVSLDYSQKGWHNEGSIDPLILSYLDVEKQYPIEWEGGRMDITHIPDRDWTLPENW